MDLPVRKTKNLEFEFFCDRFDWNGIEFRVNQHFFTPPGQKESEGDRDGRSFEQVMEIYADMIQTAHVVLLVYDLSNLESFHNLEFWISQAAHQTNAQTEFILVGTHADVEDVLEVDDRLIFSGVQFIEESIRSPAARLGWAMPAHRSVWQNAGEPACLFDG